MRILHTVQLYEPHKGGSEEVVRQISERLVAKGHDVTVATAQDPTRTFSELNGVQVASFDIKGNSTSGVHGDPEEYRSFVREFGADVILNYAAQIWTTDLSFDLLDGLTAKKVLVPCGYLLDNPVFAEYYKALPAHLKRYDALVYMSRSYQDFRFGEQVGVGDKAVIIPNGASEEEFTAEVPSFKEAMGIKTPLMALAVSNHYHLKGHRRIIDAFIATGHKDTTLVIIGEHEGPPWANCYYSCRLRSWMDRRIRILQGVPRELVVAAYKEADVFVLGSDIECAPLVIYEAMAAGTPFVSTDCGNVKDNVTAGVIVDSMSAMTEAIKTFLEDPGLRQAYGERGREKWMRDHTWSRIADQYEALYMKLVEST